MKVSFGAIYVLNDREYKPNICQKNLDKALINAFEKQRRFSFNNGREKVSVENLLENNKGDDILITNKKDGNVLVEVKRGMNFVEKSDGNLAEDTKFKKGFTPYDERGIKPLSTYFCLFRHPINLRNQLNVFINRCKDYAINPDSRATRKISAQHFDN